MKHVLITGVSTGIGRATTEELLAHGYHVFGSVRKEADAAELQASFGEGFTPLLFDVTDEAAIRAAADEVAAALDGRGLAGLVNNAGIAVPGPLMHISLEAFRHQFEVNVFGALAVTQAFLPMLGAELPQRFDPGRVVNVSSASGKIVYPFFGPYAGSKHALEAMSDALRRELNIYGIDVIVVEPGSVRTPIWEKADELDLSAYDDTDYGPILGELQDSFVARGRGGLPVERVSGTIREALEVERPKTRYPLPRRWLISWFLPRWLPDRWFDRLVTGRMGLERRTSGESSSA